MGLLLASSETQSSKADVGRWMKHRLSTRGLKALPKLTESSDLSRPRKEIYRELVVGSASDSLG